MLTENNKVMQSIITAIDNEDWAELYKNSETYLRSYMLKTLNRKSTGESLGKIYCRCIQHKIFVCSAKVICILENKDYSRHDDVIAAVRDLLTLNIALYLRTNLNSGAGH